MNELIRMNMNLKGCKEGILKNVPAKNPTGTLPEVFGCNYF